MPRTQTSAAALFSRYAAAEADLVARVGALRSDLAAVEFRLEEVSVVRAALEAQAGSKASKAETVPESTGETALSPLNEMTIVDGALHFAREQRVTEFSPSDVLGWFTAAGYTVRGRKPGGNSISASLGNELKRGQKTGEVRVEKIGRGRFRAV